LGGACVGGTCQPVAVVEGKTSPNWDGVYPWSLVLVGDSIYYSDSALGGGYVWQVSKQGGAVAAVIVINDADAAAEYCVGEGGGEGARWLVARGTHVHWHGCRDELRDLDTATGIVAALGPLVADQLAATATRIFGTHIKSVGPPSAGDVVSFSVADTTAATLADYAGEPAYIAADESYVYWSDSSGTVSKVAQTGGDVVALAQSTEPQGVALDQTYVYFSDPSLGAVLRVPKAGGTSETIATGQDTPVQIAVDGDFVYWTNTSDLGPGALMRAKKSGGAAPTQLATGKSTAASDHRGPWALALDDKAIYWTEIYGRGAIMKLAK
jgi:hypothetical protein